MIDDVVATPSSLQVDEGELTFTYVASGGPGGQNVNKRSTKAVLRWNAIGSKSIPADVRARFASRYESRIGRDGDLVLTSDRFRDQAKNRKDCLEKLAEMLRTVERPPRPRRRTKPSRSAVERRLETKRRRSAAKRLRRPPPD
jgi:ribosome-associated protein